MVSENIVADLLNRFLGDYDENLDQSQLQIGIFGGEHSDIGCVAVLLRIANGNNFHEGLLNKIMEMIKK